MSRANVHVPALGEPTPEQLAKIREYQSKYQDMTPREQMDRDAYLWEKALEKPGTTAKQLILRRLFTVLRWGGLMFRTKQNKNNWRLWSDVGWPIASALSHGGRVMIQLPRTRPGLTGRDDSFFGWLTDGEAGTGICFTRIGTHATGNRPDWDAPPLPDGRMKVLQELKGKTHGAAQATKQSAGQSYGVNLALGGDLNLTWANKQLITDNGDHGHLYIYYRPPTPDKFGSVLVGTEGEAPGRWGAGGNFHGPNIEYVDKRMGWRPSKAEGQFGQAWMDQSTGARLKMPHYGRPGTPFINGPDRYDSMLIDLTGTGWRFLQRDHEPWWNDVMVYQTAQKPRPLTRVPKRLKQLMMQKVRDAADGLSARKYMRLPDEALQLRLALFTDELKTMGSNDFAKEYREEYNELVQAIYG